MKWLFILVLICIVSISAKAQTAPVTPEKHVSLTVTYDEGIKILNYAIRIDSLLSNSDLPTNKTLPLLKKSNEVQEILKKSYLRSIPDTNKNRKTIKKQ